MTELPKGWRVERFCTKCEVRDSQFGEGAVGRLNPEPLCEHEDATHSKLFRVLSKAERDAIEASLDYPEADSTYDMGAESVQDWIASLQEAA